MIVRLGYVAMSTVVENASPSRTMTATSFAKIADREAAVRKLERLAAENLHNTLRLLRHNRAHDIQLYRFSSRLIPLIGHELLADWDPIPTLADEFRTLGDYAKEHGMRVSFHPDHFTVLSTPREEVLRSSVEDLRRHTRMLEAMGLDDRAKCNIHVGGTYGDKNKAGERFIRHFQQLDDAVRRRITLENDDKTFTALETLAISERVGAPMVLDVHHHDVNPGGETIFSLWPRIAATWTGQDIPPKIHMSSPKSEKDPRGHADYVEADKLLAFLRTAAEAGTERLDVMLEAKMKDSALFKLMEDLGAIEGIALLDQSSFELRA
ncbi:UV DNA damage repair endonuclease UvsE [Paenibacillus mesophilus]|uniref:UV DNA damage repair endonuclease UvsE n=1 Tax=Paenibacillus mesophilus TaxID=2582849 RepID=UPI00110EB7C3|nr:UV DNA damage repair endonuclease UvsE [Paenibacillus mesophilus]TMV44481.1 UV DNA damage repair endonuclease UvsE [Paenibacillus mesophilus]